MARSYEMRPSKCAGNRNARHSSALCARADSAITFAQSLFEHTREYSDRKECWAPSGRVSLSSIPQLKVRGGLGPSLLLEKPPAVAHAANAPPRADNAGAVPGGGGAPGGDGGLSGDPPGGDGPVTA